MTYVKSSPKSTPSQANELQDSLAALFDTIWNVILYAQVCNLMSFQHFFYACNFNPPLLFPFALKTILFCRKNKNISGCLFTSSQGDRCMDVILHHWNQGSAAVKWMHRHINLMLHKEYMHLPLSDLCVQYPETPSTLHCSQVQLELKENGFSQLIPQYSMQLQTHMQCRTWHLSFSCSAWQKAAGPQKHFSIWIPTHFEDWCPGQDLDQCHFLYLQI